MRIGIDKVGRVVLPKAVREQYGLDPGTELEIEESDNMIILRPIHQEPSIREKEGLLVVSAPINDDLTDVVSRMRDERSDSLATTKSRGGHQ